MGSMHGFRCDPMERVRVGVCGIGQRGIEAIRRLSNIPGLVVTAIADIEQRGLDAGNAELEKMGKPRAHAFLGPESFRPVADDPEVDLVYVTAPTPIHFRAAVYALEAGRHCAVELPCATTIEECWQLVETAERTRRHLIPLAKKPDVPPGDTDGDIDIHWSHCLMNGLTMDADVYDAATWSCRSWLSEGSADGGSTPLVVPDFTRGRRKAED